jgi:hypothetical protein
LFRLKLDRFSELIVIPGVGDNLLDNNRMAGNGGGDKSGPGLSCW